MSGEEDDKATVVIDLNALKKEKEKKEKEMAEMANALEFTTEPKSSQAAIPVIFFDFGSSLFKETQKLFPKGLNAHILTDLPALNMWLKKKAPMIVVFAYEANPKAVNQLCAQLRAKFKHVRTVLVAKNLSPEKVLLHKRSPAGADAYLKSPFTQAALQEALTPLLSKTAS